jgi:serine/threonine protein phosphatase 1
MNYRKKFVLDKNKKGRDLVIPDIHGCYRTFGKLVADLKLKPEDRLFLLGDYVNKGPDSSKVLDHIIELKHEFNVFTLRGNHEQMILDFSTLSIHEFEYHLNSLNTLSLVDSDFIIKPTYRNFMRSLPYYIELPDYFLVHAGFDKASKNPLEDYETMIWIRDLTKIRESLKGKRIIHGHIPHPCETIKQKINSKECRIPLDNGCVYPDRIGLGNLLCLELNTLEIHIQANIEG